MSLAARALHGRCIAAGPSPRSSPLASARYGNRVCNERAVNGLLTRISGRPRRQRAEEVKARAAVEDLGAAASVALSAASGELAQSTAAAVAAAPSTNVIAGTGLVWLRALLGVATVAVIIIQGGFHHTHARTHTHGGVRERASRRPSAP